MLFRSNKFTCRSGHKLALAASELVFETREDLARLFNVKDSARIVFTKNVTESLNIAINGFVEAGDTVLTTSMEHNSVMRPLRYLEQIGKISVIIVQTHNRGLVAPSAFEDVFKKEKVKLVVVHHASNVTGSLAPVGEIAQLAHKYGSCILVDAAQTAGAYPINVVDDGIDMLAFTGHKSLLGPQGTGGLFIREGIEIEPLIRGGTGSTSEKETQPGFMPDKLESGTLNIIGISGLGAGVRYILEQGVEQIRKVEMDLTGEFVKRAERIKGVKFYGPRDLRTKVSVVSFNIQGYPPSEVAHIMDRDFDIACRPGLHCAPAAHKTLGTLPQGTVRFAFGLFNTGEEIDQGLKALYEISRRDVK